MQQGRSDTGRQRGIVGRRLENQSQEVGSKRKKCKLRFSIIKKKKAFQNN